MPCEFGLIGRVLTHSFSPTYFQQKFDTLGLDDFTYEAFELATIDELPALLARRPNLAGLNVTIPYKEQVLPYLDEIAPSAARVGAVNVIQIGPNGRLVGHNTDYTGFRDSLRRQYRGPGPALVLGTGGGAKAVEAALRELGIRHWLVSRDALGRGLSYADLTPQLLHEHPLVINTTPLGMYPRTDEYPPLPYHALTPQHHLFDLIYNPSETEFLRRGREAGASTQNGFDMLCRQAEDAWRIWNS
ncbi:shikimate dehydrogenase [Hymenobacter busanensis]|uniref:Shikimate dehydrogenase n=1 Tax=Hymenobacter busanensis TaxID=2607656 RepID=A0A7L5A0J7_9BACT|nr:shikimate dehydrogenase [Hymenobacter busanensis]KAA9331656.1 shikimate dehydrogenase [Hymenobacter busanensis]QHJ08807.1 shikimate dehydrogenase [Hymenobacter busanensis]